MEAGRTVWMLFERPIERWWGVGKISNLFLTIGAIRLADGIIGKTCNFIIQSGILLSMKGDIVTNYVRTGTHRDCVRQTSTYGKRKKKGEEPRIVCRWTVPGLHLGCVGPWVSGAHVYRNNLFKK